MNIVQNEDPWKDVGGGRRLDGKPKNSGGHRAVHELSEEEQLQAAIQASMMDSSHSSNSRHWSLDRFKQEIVSMDIGNEPASGGARVQIRMPDGKRLIRKFNGEDPVKVIYAFVAVGLLGHLFYHTLLESYHRLSRSCFLRYKQSSDEAKGGRAFGLKAKFPPQDLSLSIDSSISSCGLSGEAINVTWI